MRRRMVSSALAALLLAAFPVHGVLAAGSTQLSQLAPADEYFGRLKMSILGIRNELQLLTVRLEDPRADGNALISQALFVEDAVRDWDRKYPGDPWIPGVVRTLARICAQTGTVQGHDCALRENLLISRLRDRR